MNSGNPFRDSARVLGLYLRGTALLFAIQIALYCTGFAIAEIPWWAAMAIICAVVGLIPHIGSLMGIAIVLLIAWLGGTDVLHLGIAGGVWVLVQAIEGFWLAPALIGKPLGLRPLTVFLALLAGSVLLGPLGLLLAVPALAIGLVWLRYFQARGRNTR